MKREKLPGAYLPKMSECSGCGQCLNVCPTYAVLHRESFGPRGRITIAIGYVLHHIQEDALAETFANCLQCGKCQKACPQKLPIQNFFWNIRSATKKYLPVPAWKKQIENLLLTRPGLAQFLHPPVHYLFKSARFLKKDRCLPEISLPQSAFVFRHKKEQVDNETDILLFDGCLTRHFMPELLQECMDFLQANRLSYHIASQMGCCGRPLLMRGSEITPGIIRNLEILANFRFKQLATLCPACLDVIKRVWPNNAGLTAKQKSAAKNIAQKALGIWELIKNQTSLPDFPHSKKNIFWHKPCLMTDESACVSNLNTYAVLTRQTEISSCCGAPLHNFAMFDSPFIKKQRQGKRIMLQNTFSKHIKHLAMQSGSQEIITACPGCILILRHEIKSSQEKMPVRHIISFMQEIQNRDGHRNT